LAVHAYSRDPNTQDPFANDDASSSKTEQSFDQDEREREQRGTRWNSVDRRQSQRSGRVEADDNLSQARQESSMHNIGDPRNNGAV
jgi:hypothetical protein